MKVLITGGAGFIGRWVAKKAVDLHCDVWVLDSLTNGCKDNISEFSSDIKDCIIGDIKDKRLLKDLFNRMFDVCIHLAAQINVQRSIDDPADTFENNIRGTFNVAEECKKSSTKLVFASSALVYQSAQGKKISESSPVWPSCPYSASKLAGEEICLSYYYAYGLPATVLRPFTAYGPYQKTNVEGGVTSIFIHQDIEDRDLTVFGDGSQTRDLFYVEDCADFIMRAAFSDKADGQIINAGSGKDISIKELALFICKDKKHLSYLEHHHPQAEIKQLICDFSKAEELLGWLPKTSLDEGIAKTRDWISSHQTLLDGKCQTHNLRDNI